MKIPTDSPLANAIRDRMLAVPSLQTLTVAQVHDAAIAALCAITELGAQPNTSADAPGAAKPDRPGSAPRRGFVTDIANIKFGCDECLRTYVELHFLDRSIAKLTTRGLHLAMVRAAEGSNPEAAQLLNELGIGYTSADKLKFVRDAADVLPEVADKLRLIPRAFTVTRIILALGGEYREGTGLPPAPPPPAPGHH